MKSSELVIGLVGAIGTDLDTVEDALHRELRRFSFETFPVRVIELLHEFKRWEDLSHSPEEERYYSHIRAGGEFCKELGRSDALALLGIAALRKRRKNLTGSSSKPADRTAYILRSLKRPGEVNALREIYEDSFLLIAAYSPRDARVKHLAQELAESEHALFDVDKFKPNAEKLVALDEKEEGSAVGQNVRNTFPLADVFIDASNDATLGDSLGRFLDLWFGHPFHTPTRDEFGMVHAQVAALRSAALSRQVGAAITTQDGQIVSVGTNEVPKYGGGLYWSGDDPDHREFKLRKDTSFNYRRMMLGDALKRLREMKWLSESGDMETLLEKALEEGSPLEESRIMDTIEFVREVHGEMAAITDAARRGVKIEGGTLYCTTFPCHDCARHIISSGLKRVVFVEPYQKSLAPELFKDSLSVDQSNQRDSTVSFEPFVGVSPRRYVDLFSMMTRKEKGAVVNWEPENARLRIGLTSSAYLRAETAELLVFQEQLDEKGLELVGSPKGDDTDAG